jgi:hypothetical protein
MSNKNAKDDAKKADLDAKAAADKKTADDKAATDKAAADEKAKGETDKASAVELKQDGPTVQEYVTAGYRADKYPPAGFASKSSQEEIDAAIAQQKVADQTKTDQEQSAQTRGLDKPDPAAPAPGDSNPHGDVGDTVARGLDLAGSERDKEVEAGKSLEDKADDDQVERSIRDASADHGTINNGLGTTEAMHADLDSRPDAWSGAPGGGDGVKTKVIDRPLTGGADG